MEASSLTGSVRAADSAAAPRVSYPRNAISQLWATAIGKKIVMAITGVIMIGFVILHMLGTLKIFEGSGEINAYSLFLRTVGMPELGYGDALWIVRIILLTAVILHIIAAVQLTQTSWNARPVDYIDRRDVETSFAANMMRWGGLLLAIFIVFHILHFTLGIVGFASGRYKDLQVY